VHCPASAQLKSRNLCSEFRVLCDAPVALPQAPKSQRADPNAMSAPAAAAPAPRARKGDFVDNRIGAGVSNENKPANQASAAPAPSKGGFGDSGAPAIKVHHAPGGKSSGNILGWG
jgi:hypothetical protein